MQRALIVLAAAMTLSSPSLSQPRPEVIDGDTLRLSGTTWRIHGIDAPEAKQSCADGWRAGLEATRALFRLIGGRVVACSEVTKDRYGRSVGRCSADGRDIGAQMVRDGFAWAFVRYSLEYAHEEQLANQDNLGVHNRKCEKPWDWRKAD